MNRNRPALLLVSILMAAFFVTPTVFSAETDATPVIKDRIADQEIQLMREDIRQKRRQVVAANLPLSTEESAKFWPVYDEFVAEAGKIYDARFERLKLYAANYLTMTDEQAMDHVSKVFAADKEMIDLRIKFIPKFEKALSKKKVATFVQMDRRIQMMIDLQIAAAIPLINPTKK